MPAFAEHLQQVVLSGPDRRVTRRTLSIGCVFLVLMLLLAFVAVAYRPMTVDRALSVRYDSWEYLYGATSLLHGQYVVDWDGQLPRPPLYPPGLALLLAPALAIGQSFATGLWISLLSAVVLGVAVAIVAARIGGRRAPPLAVILVVFTPAVVAASRVIMSDLPSAALVAVELVLLTVRKRQSIALVCAGFVAGYLVLMRYANVGLVLAGLAALTALDRPRGRSIALYLAGCAPAAVALLVWQDVAFGSVFRSSYQSVHTWPNGWVQPESLFSPAFIFGQPLGRDGYQLGGFVGVLALPNVLSYLLQILGADAYLCLPGVGLLGLVASMRYLRLSGPAGVLARFGLVAVLSTFLLYIPWWYQSGRFFLPAMVPLNTAAASWISAPVVATCRRALARVVRPWSSRTQVSVAPESHP